MSLAGASPSPGLDPSTQDRLKGGFDRVAASYAAARPGYPAAAVDWLVDGCSGRVLDLASGSGALTRSLVERTAEVTAAELSANLLLELRRHTPGVGGVRALAERLPFANASFGLVTVATAFHWFDARKALAEIARLLVPDGRIGLVWNTREKVDDFGRELAGLLRSALPDTMRGDWGSSSARSLEESPLFAGTERAEFPHEQLLTCDALVSLVGSRSYVIAMHEPDRAGVLDDARRLFENHADASGLVALRYRTECWRASRH